MNQTNNQNQSIMINLASPAIAPEINRFELRQLVKEMYTEVALHPDRHFHFETGRKLAEHLGYPSDTLDRTPKQALDSFAGVGYHFDLANLRKGEAVVDLGSGSGMDAFVAAYQVGSEGEVLGIDLTPAQLKKSRNLKKSGPFNQTWFIESPIENLPIIPETIDVVMSNGVINLSPNKMKVFLEAARVLKPGGRLVLSDIVSTKTLPESIKGHTHLWTASIGGAMQVNEYYNYIESAGFMILKTKENPYKFLSNSALRACKTYGIRSISLVAIKA